MAVDHRRSLRGAGVALALATAGIVASVLVSIPAFLLGVAPLAQFVAATVLSELGFVVVAVAFLALTGRGLAYLDLHVPAGRDLFGYGLGGTVLLLAVRQLAIVVVTAFDLPVAGNSITQFPGLDVLTILAVLVPISVLVIGPAEELLFRGVIQKYLYGGFSRPGAVVVSSLVFAAVHAPTAYVATPDPAAVLVALAIIFVISLALGWLYARTDSLVVPIVAHGLYDASVFALAYFTLRFETFPIVV